MPIDSIWLEYVTFSIQKIPYEMSLELLWSYPDSSRALVQQVDAKSSFVQ
jgi:hypothetical protein